VQGSHLGLEIDVSTFRSVQVLSDVQKCVLDILGCSEVFYTVCESSIFQTLRNPVIGSVLHAQIPPLDFFGATVLSTLLTPLPGYPTAAVKEACFAVKETCVAVKETCVAVKETCAAVQWLAGSAWTRRGASETLPGCLFFERTLTHTLFFTRMVQRDFRSGVDPVFVRPFSQDHDAVC